MDLRTVDFHTARTKGLFQHALAYAQVEPDLFFVRARRAFYVRAALADMLDTGLREERTRSVW